MVRLLASAAATAMPQLERLFIMFTLLGGDAAPIPLQRFWWMYIAIGFFALPYTASLSSLSNVQITLAQDPTNLMLRCGNTIAYA